MSIASASSDWFLGLILPACGILCVLGYLLAFAVSRRLVQAGARPSIRVGELTRPLVCGILLGLLIVIFHLHGGPMDPAAHAASEMSFVISALLSVSLVGICAGGWMALPRNGQTPVGQASLVTRLCVAGNTHEDATARVAVRLALAAGYDPAHAGDLTAAASLHDVGKAGIPSAILNKAGALDAAEQRVMQSHTRIGYRMMARSHEPMLDLAADIALHHHEHWDGSGYPDGLSGERIPLTSRAVLLAETFDRLLDRQPDRQPATSDQVAERLRQGAGVQFDPRLVELLLADLPGMLAARNAGAAIAAGPVIDASRPGAEWLRPGRFRILEPGPSAI